MKIKFRKFDVVKEKEKSPTLIDKIIDNDYYDVLGCKIDINNLDKVWLLKDDGEYELLKDVSL